MWENIKSSLKRPILKNALLGGLTIVIGILSSSLGSGQISEIAYFPKKVIALVVLGACYILLLAFYGTSEVNDRRTLEERAKQLSALELALSNVSAVCIENASDVNKCIHQILDSGQANLNQWSFDAACMKFCTYIYRSLSILGNNSKDFGVAYIRLVEDQEPEREIYMNGFANQNSFAPTIFGKKRRINQQSSLEDYHDVELFRQGKQEIEIIIGSEEIDKVFAYTSKDSRIKNKDKYNQYIGIPVFCNNEKMVGLLEIVCFNEAKIGLTYKELDEVAKKFLVPYSYLFLLLHKLEKALLAKPT